MGRGDGQVELLVPRRESSLLIEPLPVDQVELQPIKTRFYRSGLMSKITDHCQGRENHPSYKMGDEINRSIAIADAIKPSNRIGRGAALFASSDVESMSRWVRGNLRCNQPFRPREIFYDGPEPWVYPVLAWGSSNIPERDEHFQQGARQYFEKGLPYTQWEKRKDELSEQHLWSWGHEILLDPQHITSHRNVSYKRLSETDPEFFNQRRYKYEYKYLLEEEAEIEA